MAGNVFDWTIEATNTYGRVQRGGDVNTASRTPASSRDYYDPTSSTSYYGCRSELYVK